VFAGGANALGLGAKVGSFVVGKQFDALEIDHMAKNGPYDIFSGDSELEQLEKFIFLGDDRNITKVYVDGKLILQQ
jgi:guanine deaminase